MVAITVILAAVIATFALGFAGDSTDSPPQASVDVDVDEDNPGESTVSVTGDEVDFSETVLRNDSDTGAVDDASSLSVGQSAPLSDLYEFSSLESGEEYHIVWVEGDDTILGSFEVPA